ncbi:Alpha/Beta hydrolase protein [Amylocarpus encephaloides]|uniref:Alpha/Beta hydrolase protein n=1 Tax=Amylocarpus encephaloides TaxID=45428 RepID=A0A9P7YFN1_9HELO|nr:Alpha/Beta hydrolase protein [Amylocarpus encephaloides]
MQSFKTNDNVTLEYIDTGVSSSVEDLGKPWLLLIHGFTGSSAVWQRNIPAFSSQYRVIAPDLRGHGFSEKPKHGYQVMRLAMDIRELVQLLQSKEEPGSSKPWKSIGGSLGCSILWAYASLFTISPFTHTIFVDQAPLQNSDPSSGWDHRFCNRGMNNPLAVASLQTTLAISPETAHKGTISACLSYRSHPIPTEMITPQQFAEDEAFFLAEAMKGDPWWYGKLMADHTAIDWRDTIRACYGADSGSKTKVLVLASSRSGCFPAGGVTSVVDLVNGDREGSEVRALGVVVEWGGHWMYWEDHEKFDTLCLDFLVL